MKSSSHVSHKEVAKEVAQGRHDCMHGQVTRETCTTGDEPYVSDPACVFTNPSAYWLRLDRI